MLSSRDRFIHTVTTEADRKAEAEAKASSDHARFVWERSEAMAAAQEQIAEVFQDAVEATKHRLSYEHNASLSEQTLKGGGREFRCVVVSDELEVTYGPHRHRVVYSRDRHRLEQPGSSSITPFKLKDFLYDKLTEWQKSTR